MSHTFLSETMDELWAWVTLAADGKISLVAMSIDGRDLPLITHDVTALHRVEWVARSHAKATGQKVWLRKYVAVVDHDPLEVNDA